MEGAIEARDEVAEAAVGGFVVLGSAVGAVKRSFHGGVVGDQSANWVTLCNGSRRLGNLRREQPRSPHKIWTLSIES